MMSTQNNSKLYAYVLNLNSLTKNTPFVFCFLKNTYMLRLVMGSIATNFDINHRCVNIIKLSLKICPLNQLHTGPQSALFTRSYPSTPFTSDWKRRFVSERMKLWAPENNTPCATWIAKSSKNCFVYSNACCKTQRQHTWQWTLRQHEWVAIASVLPTPWADRSCLRVWSAQGSATRWPDTSMHAIGRHACRKWPPGKQKRIIRTCCVMRVHCVAFNVNKFSTTDLGLWATNEENWTEILVMRACLPACVHAKE